MNDEKKISHFTSFKLAFVKVERRRGVRGCTSEREEGAKGSVDEKIAKREPEAVIYVIHTLEKNRGVEHLDPSALAT